MGMLGVAAGAAAAGLGGAIARDDVREADQARAGQAQQEADAAGTKSIERMQRQSTAMRTAMIAAYQDATASLDGKAAKYDALLKAPGGADPQQPQQPAAPLTFLGVQFAPGSLNADQLAQLQELQAATHSVINDRTTTDRDKRLAVSDLREEAALLSRAAGGQAEVFGTANAPAARAWGDWGGSSRASTAGAAAAQEGPAVAQAQAALVATNRRLLDLAADDPNRAAAQRDVQAAERNLYSALWADEATRRGRRAR